MNVVVRNWKSFPLPRSQERLSQPHYSAPGGSGLSRSVAGLCQLQAGRPRALGIQTGLGVRAQGPKALSGSAPPLDRLLFPNDVLVARAVLITSLPLASAPALLGGN